MNETDFVLRYQGQNTFLSLHHIRKQVISMQLSLHNGSSSGVTIISNIFIDHYMPHANGEFVKIYLYLLRCLRGDQTNLNLSQVADVFNCTESDVLRTLRYWETKQLVVLSETSEQTSIDFLEPVMPSELKMTSETKAASKKSEKAESLKTASTTKRGGGRTAQTAAASSIKEAAPTLEPEIPQKEQTRLTADRIKELSGMEEVRQMLFIAEQYLGTTLSRTATEDLLYIYENLNFSVDLIDYLIEYCVSKGSKDMHYIKAVAFKWYEAGIDTVTKAKQNTTVYHRNYFTILRAFGITNRNPVSKEISMINHWMNDYGFTMDILTEACSRTIHQTGKANFNYADKILRDWHSKGVRHLTDIQALDTLHRQLKAERASEQNKPTKTNNSGNKFNNFKQRDYDYAQLENQLLNQ